VHAVIGGGCFALAFLIFSQQLTYQKLEITTPPTAGGLPQLNDELAKRYATQQVDYLKSQPFVDDAIAAVYGSVNRPVMVSVAAFEKKPSEAEKSSFVQDFSAQLRTLGATGTSATYSAGDLGSQMGCTSVTPTREPASVCAWLDDWTLGYVIAPGLSSDELAGLTRQIRSDVED